MEPSDPPTFAGEEDDDALLDEVENAPPTPGEEDRDVDSLMMQGLTLLAREKYSEAEARLRAALEQDPKRAKAHVGLGRILELRGKTALAILHYQTATAIDPNNGDAFVRLGDAYLALGKSAPALAAYDRALRANPRDARAHYHEALALLANGYYARGWRGYEWRWRVPDPTPRMTALPAWDGKTRTNDMGEALRLLVEGEGSAAEAIFYAHCLPDVLAGGVRVGFLGDPGLAALLRRSFQGVDVVEAHARHSAFDAAIALGSLPGIFRARRSDFDNRPAGYLVADPEATVIWRERYRTLGAGRKLGLALRGEAVWPAREATRIPLPALTPLLEMEGLDLVSLESEPLAPAVADAPASRLPIGRWPDGGDLDALAARVDACDLVAAPPGRIAALAGALGKTVFVLAPPSPGWPWLLRGRKSPWFPTMTILRLRPGQDWKKANAALVAELKA